MRMSAPCDGFQLAYERHGERGQAVVLVHGWPGDHTDFRRVVPLLADELDVVVPDLRGFGRSDKHPVDPADGYSATAQARSVVALIDELDLRRPVVAGYDVGSRVAQTIATNHPAAVSRLVISPPLPGAGDRVLEPAAQREFWYQAFHQLPLIDELIDGNRDAVHSYLRHFWSHWSGPDYVIADADLEHLVDVYSDPGAFTASIGWYRAGAGMVASSLAERTPDAENRIGTSTSVLWPEHDPLFPRAWSDRIDEFFGDADLHPVGGAGHFTPVECPADFAELVKAAATAG